MTGRTILIEGGGDSKELHTRCREAFSGLLKRCGCAGRMPRLVACGGREAAYKDFAIAHRDRREGDFVALLVDSEDPVADVERTWDHLKSRDKWDRPQGAGDEQVLLMTTCMESWIVADRQALREHFGSCLRKNKLPDLTGLEARPRDVVQNALGLATRDCPVGYTRGKTSFALVGKLNPEVLRRHLPSFERFERVLSERL